MTNAIPFPPTTTRGGAAPDAVPSRVPTDETADAAERREFTTSLGTLMLGQLAHALAQWQSTRSRPVSSGGNTDEAGRVRAGASEIGGPVAGVARSTACRACGVPLARSRYGWLHDAHGVDEVLRVLACPEWGRARER